uniref:protein BTG3-like n=1 Tax=Doryrhamphus excisus TaxID=161450 RepID=UPI0025AE23B5|nr:protein BTG3-like [Doryrhamphus excisus]
MEKEITDAVFPLMKTLISKKLEFQKTKLFIERLSFALQEKFAGHWYPENPSKGEAYRCIRVNQYDSHDPELLRACHESGLQFCDLRLPLDFTLWINPGEAFCRIGEDNPPFSVASVAAIYEEDSAMKMSDTSDSEMSDYNLSSSSDEDTNAWFPMSYCTELNPLAPAWYPTGYPEGKGTREKSRPSKVLQKNILKQSAAFVRTIKMT